MVAQGERSVVAGRDMTGNTIITSDNNQIDQSTNVFNQKEQTVYGSQTNIDGNVHTDGGLFNAGSIHTGGGDLVGRSQMTGSIDAAQLEILFAGLLSAAATVPEKAIGRS